MKIFDFLINLCYNIIRIWVDTDYICAHSHRGEERSIFMRTSLKVNRFIISVLIIMLSISGCVFAFEDGMSLKSDIFTYTVSGSDATITCVEDVNGVVKIPATIGEYNVVAIGNGAFGGSKLITEVHIPDSVSSIGDMCFAYSQSIRAVYLPAGANTVPEGTFYQSAALECVSIPYGVTSIASKAFAMCPKLTAVKIPNSIKNIADDAFDDSENVRFYCYLNDNAVGYKYAQSKNIDCEEMITVYVNNQEIAFDQPPITEKKRFRTLVPMRAVLECMGAEIEWYNDMNYAGIDIDGHRLLIKPDSEFMMVDGKARTLNCPAVEYNNRILLPIRDVVEAVGGKVSWDEYSKTVSVTYNK